MGSWLKKLFCRHEMYLEDMSRLSDVLVVGYCHKCKKRFADTHGLAFGVNFARRADSSSAAAEASSKV